MQTSSRSPVLAPLVVAGSSFMENLDGTVIATALPQMAHSFGASAVSLSIGVTAYLLTVAVFIPISGWMADRFGARTVFASAIAIFTLASALCGFSNSLWSFTAARILQGVGGSMMLPVGRIVVMRTAGKQDLMRAIATITWPALIAPVLGPPLGGFITTYASWRWIFFLNLPLGIVALTLVLFIIRNERTDARKPFDLRGFLLTAAALALMMYGLDLSGRAASGWLLPLAIVAVGLAIGIVAVRHALARPQPIVSLRPVRIQTFTISSVTGGTLFRVTVGATPVLLPLMFQIGFGMDAFRSGLLVLFYAGGNLAMKTVTTRTLRLFGFRNVLVVNSAAVALSLIVFAFFRPAFPAALMAVLLFAGGLARSLQFTSLNTLAFADIGPKDTSDASTLYAMVQQIAFGMGAALAAVLVNVSQAARGAAVPDFSDFRTAFLALALIVAISVLFFLRLRPDAGSEVSSHRPARSVARPAAGE
ncbi:drug resistance transporter, EmrB/QacA subfamily [Faunimonas pinastri]|uniref:Drug resistance transporter, EmrB/QacA subfamily n=1 Tax=Faunimonas pinastri TaxID=1855383 RepID=A0A1H9D8V1_9HYPH|nr:MFS transporter [Faunimonas pinastri]SEQ09900.1 drug resistance transporter, EmrB/QacA subfamily [Faunimonas pinastri]